MLAAGEVLRPWRSVAREPELEAQLERELGPDHPLHRVGARAIARRQDNDDVLFALDAGPAEFAVVHLTWARDHADTGWPKFELYDTLAEWKRRCMQRDHDDWSRG